MRYPLVLSVLILLAGCAGTRQASTEAVPEPVASAAAVETTPVVAVKPADVPAAPVLALADATPRETRAQVTDPLQCMMAWSRGVQDALMPWVQTVQACDTTAKR